MHSDQIPYRNLHDRLLNYQGQSVFHDAVLPWLAEVGEEIAWLAELRHRISPDARLSQEENWRLYALSRVVDLLTLSASEYRSKEPDGWHMAPISDADLLATMSRLGLERHSVQNFHPFFHEIVTVVPLTRRSEPEVLSTLWPGFRLGPLLISRAGCAIAARPEEISPHVAPASTLYWAYARNNRPTEDLGKGWGSNSQWRTSFRMDFEIDGTFFLNVAAEPLSEEEDGELNPGLEPEEKIELLRHRCFVKCTKAHAHRWPYDWTMIEQPHEPLQLRLNG